ncbi:NUDIX hydrolase [Fredinandcohnia humi]
MVWKVLRSATEKKDRFKIVIDQVVFPNNREGRFSYVDFAKGVCILAITNDSQVLCLHQYRHSLKSWQWELPAGAIDATDRDPLETAKRELQEETGYVANSWTPIGSVFPSPGSTSEEIFLFLATDLEPSIQSLEDSEQLEVHLISLVELKQLITKGKFQHGAGLAAVARYLASEE